MKTNQILIAVSVLLLAALGCGLIPKLPSLPSLPKVPGTGEQTIWPDVPPFEGATQDAAEALGTNLFNQAQADQKSKMETMIFRTSKSPVDVAAFYTDERMKAQGWSPAGFGSGGGCRQDKLEGQPRTMCSFTKKNEEGRQIDLTIDARIDEKIKSTRLIFVRTTGALITK